MKGGISQLMKQAQKMQADLQKAQEEMADTYVSGESGGGMVRVEMNCKHQVRRVTFEDSLMGDDKEMLEDLIAAAVNDAVSKVERTTQEKFAGLASGLNLPAGMKLPI